MAVSVIILNYKTLELTLNCIKSIKDADWGDLSYEIILVDNGSDEKIGETVMRDFPDIIIIQNKKNLGMGAGNNVGIRQAKGEYIIIMNPDTTVFKDAFMMLYKLMESDNKIGIAGPKQFYPDRTLQYSAYKFPDLTIPIYRRTPLGKLSFAKRKLSEYLMKDFNHNETKEVDWLLGSFLFCRAECLKQIGNFDERFFMYFEDTDLCRRAWRCHWKVVYCPKSVIIHNHKRESAGKPWYSFLWSRTSRTHVMSWIKYEIKWRMILRDF